VVGPPPGFAANPASPSNGVVAGAAAAAGRAPAAARAPLDATNATTQGVSILPPAPGASLDARPQGPTLLSGTMVPAAASQAAPAPAANRGATAANRPR
jgi:hypothetical protein